MSIPVIVKSNAINSLIKSVPYFQRLDDAALKEVAEAAIIRHYKANCLVFLEGDPNAGLNLVTEGLCKIYRLSEGGREHILTTLRPGDSCNEVSVVDGGLNPVSCATLEPSTIWVISSGALNRLRRNHSAINEMIIQNLAMRCRQLVQRVYNLSFLSVTGRLAAFLLQQSDQQNELNRHRWTQDEIAAHLGTVREMVTRAFRELQQAKLILVDRHRIELLDREGLEALT